MGGCEGADGAGPGGIDFLSNELLLIVPRAQEQLSIINFHPAIGKPPGSAEKRVRSSLSSNRDEKAPAG
jgi:hypothetical protein